ncbi:hypothetical protein [Sinorhizobium sp. BG8]|uniref:hypothetical protein n=1 Tax=Sinorhizobium sp. BG8 TaxID=2613773 RepID=UPI00193D52E0|nr:hypothetical protein [Sinorhizobium sp. BG8]
MENQVFAPLSTQAFHYEAHHFSLSLYDIGRNAKKCPDLATGALDRFLEIIYNARNTPAVGVIFIQAPNPE